MSVSDTNANSERDTNGVPDLLGGGMNPCLLLDEVVHQRTRLALLCELSAVTELDFNGLRDLLGLSDGNLARHLTVLSAAGMIRTEKRIEGRRRRTYAQMTEAGTDALGIELDLLGSLIRFRVRPAGGDPALCPAETPAIDGEQ